MDEYSCIYVPRNKAWFEALLPKIQDTWNIIQKEQKEQKECIYGSNHRMPNQRQNEIESLVIHLYLHFLQQMVGKGAQLNEKYLSRIRKQ